MALSVLALKLSEYIGSISAASGLNRGEWQYMFQVPILVVRRSTKSSCIVQELHNRRLRLLRLFPSL